MDGAAAKDEGVDTGPGRRLEEDSDRTIVLSFVIPMYDVEAYLPDLLRSLETQSPGDYRMECIFVDDGSPDRSAEIVAAWIEALGTSDQLTATLVRQANRGVSHARNRGLELATGDWVTFTDSDDILDRSYCKAVARFLSHARSERSAVVATNIKRYSDADDEIQDVHTLRFKFKGSAKNVDLRKSPHYVQMSAASAFFRRTSLMSSGVRFLTGLHASEDALFVSEVLLAEPEPILGIVPDAVYLYRKRATNDSAVDSYLKDAASFFDRFSAGYLPLFERNVDSGSIPEWLAHQMLYELKWLFTNEKKVSTRAHVLGPAERERFLDQVAKLLAFVPDEAVLGFRSAWLPLETRYLLLALKGAAPWRGRVHVERVDARTGLMFLTYYFTGDLPEESFRIRARDVAPTYGKTRTVDYFGQRLLRERRIWLPASSWLAVDLDGVRQELVFGVPAMPKYAITEKDIWRHFGTAMPTFKPRRGTPAAAAPAAVPKSADRRVRGKERETDKLSVARVQATADSRRSRRRFSDAWVFMDRLNQAQDNAEHLYRYVMRHEPSINAWFVLQRDARDWDRLRREGFRLVEYGSEDHRSLMLNAVHSISSHADVEMIAPVAGEYYRGRRRPRFTFLQHGVTKDDLSIWLNPKSIDMLVCATSPEFDSFAGDDTPYYITGREARLTGFPRMDRLEELSRTTEKSIVLVAPTWRDTLVKPKVVGSAGRDLVEDFWATDYARAWSDLLSDDRLLKSVREAGMRVVFLPHPNLAAVIGDATFHPDVEVRSYSDGDVQELFASSRVLVTDYSSIAFDVAFAGGDVVYFQFDRGSMFEGGHTMTRGYFDYERDGFGPVVQEVDGAVDAIATSVATGASGEYAARVDDAFGTRRTGACKRVVSAIRSMDTPVRAV